MSERTWEFESPRGQFDRRGAGESSAAPLTRDPEVLGWVGEIPPRVVPVETPWPRLCRSVGPPLPERGSAVLHSREIPSSGWYHPRCICSRDDGPTWSPPL